MKGYGKESKSGGSHGDCAYGKPAREFEMPAKPGAPSGDRSGGHLAGGKKECAYGIPGKSPQ